jgi:hypothetical protein
MSKGAGLGRIVHPFGSVSGSKFWAKVTDRALGTAIVTVGVVFLFHSRGWVTLGIVLIAGGLAMLVGALFVPADPGAPPAPRRPRGVRWKATRQRSDEVDRELAKEFRMTRTDDPPDPAGTGAS